MFTWENEENDDEQEYDDGFLCKEKDSSKICNENISDIY